MELGLLSERGGLSRENDPFIWDPIKESLEGACKRLLALYDRVLLLMTRPPFGAHLALAEALRERYPGRILLHDSAADLRANPKVREAYLGG